MSDSEPRSRPTSPKTEEELETAHFNSVIATFEQYRSYSLSANSRRLKDFHALPSEHQKLLNELGWRQKIDEVDKKIETNAAFFNDILDYPDIFGEDDGDWEDDDDEHGHDHGHSHDRSHSHDHGSSHDHGGHDHGHSHDHSHSHDSHSHHDHKDDSDDEKDTTEHEPHPYDSLNHGQHSHDHSHGDHGHSHSLPEPNTAHKAKKSRVRDSDMDKLRSTLKQFVRDWSLEGKPERDACYLPMIEALNKYFKDVSPEDKQKLRVLVPGAGLARLAYDVIRQGYSCQGNEFSHFMLLSSYFVLNRTTETFSRTIYPYIHSFSNLRTSDALLRGVKIPDVLPSDIPKGCNFSLVAGDFEEIYSVTESDGEQEAQQGKWDAVMTCFFIDTAKNVINYLTIIHRILAPGGVWINLGPLLWHFENSSSGEPSIELSLDEVRTLAEKIGFDIKDERTVDTTYTGNPDGMLGYVYKSAFWTATKRA